MNANKEAAREGIAVGIIGMGDMGKMYARRIATAGWRVNACDRPDKCEALTAEFADRQCAHLLQRSLGITTE